MKTIVYEPKRGVSLRGQETPVVDPLDFKLSEVKTVTDEPQCRLGCLIPESGFSDGG